MSEQALPDIASRLRASRHTMHVWEPSNSPMRPRAVDAHRAVAAAHDAMIIVMMPPQRHTLWPPLLRPWLSVAPWTATTRRRRRRSVRRASTCCWRTPTACSACLSGRRRLASCCSSATRRAACWARTPTTWSCARPRCLAGGAPLELTRCGHTRRNFLDLFPEDRGTAAALLAAAVTSQADAPPAVAHLRAPATADESGDEQPYCVKGEAARSRTFLEAKLSSDVRSPLLHSLACSRA